MRAPTKLSLVSLSLGLAILACDDRKMKAEEHAEQIAKSSAVADANADGAPDPTEVKYLARKRALEEQVTDMKADEGHVMAHDSVATPGVLRHYFDAGAEGDKAAKDLEAKRKKDGTDGYRIKGARIVDVRFVGASDAEVDVIEETTSKGSSACLFYSQRWTSKDNRWLFRTNASVTKVDCEK